MPAAEIKKAPTAKATNLTTPKRVGGAFTATWKVPTNATKDTNTARWTYTYAIWTITYNNKVNGAWHTVIKRHKLETNVTTDSLYLSIGSLYPSAAGAKNQVRSVSVRIRGWNAKGYGPNVDATLTMQVPDKPTIAASYNSSNGHAEITVTAKNVDGAKHRYDDVVTIKRSGTGGSSTLTNASVGTGTTRTWSPELSNSSSLTAGQCIKVAVSAYNRGMRGNGAAATKNLYIVHPNAPTCGTPEVKFVTKNVYSTASIVVPIKSTGMVKLKDGTKLFPTTIKLQRLTDSSSTNATDAAAEQGWTDVSGAVDGGACSGLMDAWSDSVSAQGLRTWYRAVAIRDGYTQYGTPVFAKCVYVAAAAANAGTAAITSLTSNASGTAASLEWTRAGFSNGGGIEFSYSDSSTAWSSSAGPTAIEVTTNNASGTRTIGSLTTGTRYYMRVRGFAVRADGSKKYGAYSDTTSVTIAASTGTAAITSIAALSGRTGAKLVMTKEQSSDAIEISWSTNYYAWSSNVPPETALTSTGYDSGSQTNKTWYVYGLQAGATYYFRARPVDNGTYGAYSARTSFTIEEKVATVGTAGIGTITSGTDGQTLVVPVTRTEANDGVQLSWSTDADAWASTAAPKTFDVTELNNKSGTAYVKGLTEGATYYFRARCYDETGGERIYGEWCGAKTGTPYGEPGEVTCTFPAVVPVGEPFGVSWAHSSASTQRQWRVYVDGKVAASGDDARGSATVTREYATGIAAGTHTGYVSITTGTGWANSDTAQFQVAAPPTGTLAVAQTLTAQPLSLSLTGGGDKLDALVVVTADGCAEDDLRDAQPTGLTVWSGELDGIAWTADDDAYAATVTLPAGLDLRDGASYAVAVTLVDGSTGLSTELPAAGFTVAWSHQAVAPAATVTVDGLTATIATTAPDGAAETDVCDVWRWTPDGGYLIAEGRAFGEDVVDGFAPYCEREGDWTPFYRVVTRTVDGDVDYVDAEYDLRSDLMRVDWGDGRGVSLAYELSASDSWSKAFEAVEHLDGTVGGSWARGVRRTSSVSGAMVRTTSAEDAALLRELAQHVGPAFVRLNNGSAFMAHVEVSSLSWAASTYRLSAKLSARELTLTGAYMAEPPDEGEGE